MDSRNFTFLFYGFLAAWLILFAYIVSVSRRGARLRRELEEVKRLANLPDSDAPTSRS
jgi:CcmD family protein